MQNQGKLIVIEGTDGSGKATQTKLLMERLAKEGRKARTLSFPQYGKKSAGPVEEYLSGIYGRADKVSPYAASTFFAVDRLDLALTIRELLRDGFIVVLDRYVDSNVGHQGGKIKDAKERGKFVHWLYDFEYRILNIPKPDIVLVLHINARLGQELAKKRETDKGAHPDSHEGDIEHLENAEKAYLWLTKKYHKDHKLIECVEGGKLLSPEEVHKKVWMCLMPYVK